MSYLSDRRDADREDRRLVLEHQREVALLKAEQRRIDEDRAKADREDKATARRETVRAVRRWCGAHVVDLLIYPLMLVSAAIAVPLAAQWGTAHLGETGALLPILSEWGMVAFSIAVHVSRVRTPDRPVWALQVGTWVFAAVGFAIAVIRGATTPEGGGWDLGLVMGLVSVAGVAAHQLVSAAPRRSPEEREQRRSERAVARGMRKFDRNARREQDRIAATRRAAIAHAVAEIDQDGRARLVFQPGRYTLRRGKLLPAAVAGLPVEPAVDGELGYTVADEAAAYLAGLRFRRLTDDPAGQQTTPPDEGEGSGGVATVDPTHPRPPLPIADAGDIGTDQPEESGSDRAVPARRKSAGRRSARTTIPEPKRRTFEQLRELFEAALAERPDGFDPTNAESIRRTLSCGKPHSARLRDEYLSRPGGTD